MNLVLANILIISNSVFNLNQSNAMRRILQLASLLTLGFVLCSSGFLFAQGVTTSGMNGRVLDQGGSPLPGATIVAVHNPTGTRFGNVTGADGYFRIANMNVGGPYSVTVSFVGFEDYVQNNIFLQLGQTFRLSVELSESATELAEVVITSTAGEIFDGNRTGASSTVNERTINELPTVARAIGDFVRFNPQANIQEGNDGFTISLNGMNNRYNTIFIDGAVNNDVFGLAGSGTNGGQTGVSPVSLDAIEQFQISLAPFDVRQSGFAGGAINAVTRSGSNELEGSVYYFFRADHLAGRTPSDRPEADVPRLLLDNFTAKTTGFRLGGPIVRDKVFFFINGEIQRDETPQPFNINQYTGDTGAAGVAQLRSKLATYGYDPGAFDANTAFLNSDKITARFDINIGDNHKLTARHSYTKADNLEARRSGSRSLSFINGSEAFLSNTYSTAVELKSTFGSNMANQFIAGYTAVRDDRDPSGDPFPAVEIEDGSGSIFLGAETFSTANQLDQDIFTITNNFEIYKGAHTITIGTHNEFYDVYNLFIPFNYGDYTFLSLNDFLTDQPADFFIRSFSLRDNVVGDGSIAAAVFKGSQLGFYVQDEWQATDNLKLTIGVRADIPMWDDTPLNSDFNTTTIPLLEAEGYELNGAQTGSFVDTQVMLAPRIGFNWDLKGDQTTQVRGGIGIFNSRVPLVWPGGAYNNYGLNRGTDLRFGDLVFEPDINNQFQSVTAPATIPSGDIDLFDPDFKIPQVMKANIAIDQKLPWGLIGTLEFLYNDRINDVLYQNINLRPSAVNATGTPDDRPLYDRRDEVDPTYGRIMWGSNTNEGYSYNFTAQVQKPFDNGFSGSLAYTYGDAWSIFDGTSSQNSSQWRGLHSVEGRNLNFLNRNGIDITPDVQRSDFSMGSRIVAQASYRKEYGNNFATQISLFYNGQSGRPYSYIYNDGGRFNDEDSRERSLIFVPAQQSDIILIDNGSETPAQQWAALDAFISQDDYLSERRGQYAERNQSRTPFESILDLRILQDIYLEMANGKRNTLQLSLDIFNLGNLINEDWGRIYNIGFGNFELLNFEGFQADGTTPEFTFDGVEESEPWFDNADDAGIRSSRWQMQIGVRYIFN